MAKNLHTLMIPAIAVVVFSLGVTTGSATFIQVEGTASSAAIGGGTTTSSLSNFTVPDGGGRMLVVALGGEGTFSATSVTFGSQSFVEAGTQLFSPGGNTMSSIWVLPNPDPTTADITTNVSGSFNGWAFGAVALSGVAGVLDVATNQNSVGGNLSAALSGGIFSVEAVGRNNNGPINPLTGQTILVNETALGGGAGFVAGFGGIDSPAQLAREWFITGGSNRNTIVAVSFFPVPEPSTGLLVAVAGCGVLRCRRRFRLRHRS